MKMEKHASIWSYVSGLGTAIFGGLTLQDFAIWVGIITTVGTFALNWYYKAREDRRAAHRRK